MSRMPTLKALYRPLLFTTNGHVETIFAAKLRRKSDITYRRENVVMPDKGIVSLDWRVPLKGEKVRLLPAWCSVPVRSPVDSRPFNATELEHSL